MRKAEDWPYHVMAIKAPSGTLLDLTKGARGKYCLVTNLTGQLSQRLIQVKKNTQIFLSSQNTFFDLKGPKVKYSQQKKFCTDEFSGKACLGKE